MRAFKSNGELKRLPWEMFGPDSWLAIFHGLGYLPKSYCSSADNMPLDYLAEHLDKMQQMVNLQVETAPSHCDHLKSHCNYQALSTEEAVCS